MFALTVTKGIVSLHGGTIAVSSEGEGKGSTFTVELPLYEGSVAYEDVQMNGGSDGLLGQWNDLILSDETDYVHQCSKQSLQDHIHNVAARKRIESASYLPHVGGAVDSSLDTPVVSDPEEEVTDDTTSPIHPSEEKCNTMNNSVSYHNNDNNVLVNSEPNTSNQVLNVPRSPPPSFSMHNVRPCQLYAEEEDTVAKVRMMASASRDAKEEKYDKSNGPLPVHVLVVDDANTNRKMLCRSLKGIFHSIDQAVDGIDAVEKVRQSLQHHRPYDLILMDFFMPNMDGPTATKRIRSDLGFKGLIIGVTGNALPEDIHTFKTCGADKVLIKPVDIYVLRSVLK